MKKFMQKLKFAAAMLISTTLVLNSLLFSIANAQTLDIESPLIEHDVVEMGTAGESQIFTATVTDNNSVESVEFYYRIGATGDFTSKVLSKGEKDSYTSEIGTKVDENTTIQYYFKAIDVAGNEILRGLSFNPLERKVLSPAEPQAEAPSTGVDGASPTAEKKSKTLWYVLGGLLLAGVIGAAAGGGEGGGGGGGGTVTPTECSSSCSVSFTISPP